MPLEKADNRGKHFEIKALERKADFMPEIFGLFVQKGHKFIGRFHQRA